MSLNSTGKSREKDETTYCTTTKRFVLLKTSVFFLLISFILTFLGYQSATNLAYRSEESLIAEFLCYGSWCLTIMCLSRTIITFKSSSGIKKLGIIFLCSLSVAVIVLIINVLLIHSHFYEKLILKDYLEYLISNISYVRNYGWLRYVAAFLLSFFIGIVINSKFVKIFESAIKNVFCTKFIEKVINFFNVVEEDKE